MECHVEPEESIKFALKFGLNKKKPLQRPFYHTNVSYVKPKLYLDEVTNL